MESESKAKVASARSSGNQPNDMDLIGPSNQLRRRRDHSSLTADEDDESNSRLPPLRRPSSSRTDSSLDENSSILNGDDEIENQSPELSLWYSLPLLVAVLPALAGVAFKRGAVLLTDFALLAVCAFFLHYCLVSPWVWYHSAQVVKVSGSPSLDTIVEEDDTASLDENGSTSPSGKQQQTATPQSNREIERQIAHGKLRQHETLAFAACFAGPLLGALILHYVRSSLSQLGDELVSNLHLTLFVLGAEIRPLRHLMKMAYARTIHLQRVVRQDPHALDSTESASLSDLTHRLQLLETTTHSSPTSPIPPSPTETEESLRRSQTILQSQIDALNRAVRRYEKRATAQAIATEARLRDLDARLKDALALAAAAATSAQRPGVVDGAKAAVSRPLVWLAAILTWPLRILSRFVVSALYQLGVVQRTPRRRAHGVVKGASLNSRGGRERHVLTGGKM